MVRGVRVVVVLHLGWEIRCGSVARRVVAVHPSRHLPSQLALAGHAMGPEAVPEWSVEDMIPVWRYYLLWMLVS